MKVVVFNTLQEANELQNRDYLLYLETLTSNLARTQTTAWANPVERIDGKFDYPALEHADYTGYVLEDYDINNYSQEAL
jgi:hypothetical protein